MKQLWQHPTEPRRNRVQIRCAGFAVVAALAGSLATVAPTAAAYETTSQKAAVAMSQEQCPDGAWKAFAGFGDQSACVSTMAEMTSPADSGRELTPEPPPECEDPFGFRPNTCP